MSIYIDNFGYIKTDQEDKPLTREDVEHLLQEAGSSDRLNLSGRNLKGIDLSKFTLQNTKMLSANLNGANLSGANISNANLYGIDLRWAILRNANLSDTNLSEAILTGADLRGTNLTGTNLSGANLDFILLGATDQRETKLSKHKRQLLRDRGAIGLDIFIPEMTEIASILHIRVLEAPLTVSNLSLIISNLTELSTKYWLIANGRYADLTEYTQTHNGRFAEEANIIITRVNYNSPFSMDWKVDISAPSVAEAVVKTIDGIKQRDIRLELAQLEVQAKAQANKQAEQKGEQDNQSTLLEQEEQRLKLEERRLDILGKQLEVQKKAIEYAMDLAGKMIDLLHPGADAATRAMEIQTLLPNLIQLESSKGLELTLPVTQIYEEGPK